MLLLSETQIEQLYGVPEAIDDLRQALISFQAGEVENPTRTVLGVPRKEASALYMPSAAPGLGVMATKVVTIFPQNPAQGRPTTQGVTLLSSADTGEHLAVLGASYLTRLRTGALSALAAEQLARRDAGRLAMIGCGGMALHQVLCLNAVRPLRELRLYSRRRSQMEAFARKVQAFLPDTRLELANSADEAVAASDMVACATRSLTPVFDGSVLQPGTFITGIGSFLPEMHELDLTTIQRASKIVLDTAEDALHEAGELIHAQSEGVWSFEQAHGSLPQLVARAIPGRENDAEIIFFKCVGTAYFDLAVAFGAYQKARQQGAGTVTEL